jgi:hypothetical protein
MLTNFPERRLPHSKYLKSSCSKPGVLGYVGFEFMSMPVASIDFDYQPNARNKYVTFRTGLL